MKKYLLYSLLFISLAWVSCKKDNHTQTNPQGKLYPVDFNVSNFDQQNSPINQSSKLKVNDVTPDASNILKIMYKLYDASNALKKTVIVKKGQPNFGAIRDSLVSGNYTAVFIGIIDTTDFYQTATTFYYSNTGNLNLQETFYKKISFTVGTTDLQESIVLQRLNSELQVVIKDPIPAGVNEITVTVNSVGFQYNYLADTSSNSGSAFIDVAVPANKIGTSNFTMGPIKNFIASNHPSSITITALKSGSEILVKKNIYNIQFQRNTQTILSGNLFTTDPTTGGFVIGFEPYNPTGITQTF